MTAPLVAVVGATGTGKSELSLDLAEAFAARGLAAEIVNADAMQQYRGMDIGTAKLPADERRGIPHHMVDTLDPADDASVAAYQADARATIEAIERRGAVAVLVGGSGLYVSSVIHDLRFPATDPQVRQRLEAELEVLGPGELHRRLAERDPASARVIDPANGRRIVRALEVIELTGDDFGAGLPETSAPWRATMILRLETPRDVLVPRLDARVRAMWRDGLVDEVARLQPAGFGVTAGRAIGYAQAIAQVRGELDEADAIEQTAALTRRYARRQVSWFRRYRDAVVIDHDDPDRVGTALSAVVRED